MKLEPKPASELLTALVKRRGAGLPNSVDDFAFSLHDSALSGDEHRPTQRRDSVLRAEGEAKAANVKMNSVWY